MNLKFLAVLVALLAITLVYAADVELKEFYGPGELLSGTISMNLTNDASDSNLSAVISGNSQSVNLIDFLNNSGAAYSCMPSDCSNIYSASSPFLTKRITNGIFALYIPSGKEIVISKVNFSIKGNFDAKSCGVIPVKMDILNDGIIDWQYIEPVEMGSIEDKFCSTLHSNPSYNSSVSEAVYNIISEKYCEKIDLISSKKFLLGANISKGTVPVNLLLSITDGENEAKCQINWSNGMQTCEVNFTASSNKQYYVCIESDSDDSDTMILGETQSPTCGQYGLSEFQCNQTSIDYALFAQPGYYKAFTNKLEFSNSVFEEFSNDNLEGYLQEYIDNKYGADCSAGCTIPIKITSYQETEFADLTLKYASNLGAKTEKNFYSASISAAKINMSEQTLKIEKAGFIIPAAYGNVSLKLMLGDKTLYSDKIRIEKIPRILSISPVITSGSSETKFTVKADSPKGNLIMSYEWDFGDGGNDYTDVPYSSHAYSIGNYTLTVKATDSEGLYNQKEFEIMVEEPVKIVNITLEKKNNNLISLKKEIEKIPLWYRTLIKDLVDVSLIDTKLKMFEADFKKPDADFVTIKLGLDDFFVPSIISEDNYETPIHSEPQSKYIGKIDNSEVDEEQLNEKINAWAKANIDMTAFYSVKTALEDLNEEDLATEYDIEIKSSGEVSFDDIYLIIISPTNDIVFRDNYTEYMKQNVDGATGFIMNINSDAKTIEFAVKGNHPVDEFTIFASPKPDAFGPEDGVICGDKICDKAKGETYAFCPDDCSKPYWRAFGWIALIAIVIGLGIFVIWKYYAALYDKNLRAKLFKPVEDFYKISFFISNAMNSGTREKEILDTLEKAGWKKSQIDYAMQKVREQTRAMQKKSILAFVQRELNARKEEKEIRTKLKESGWNHKLIDWAFKEANKKK